jgi:acetyl-CoA carboxylase biotin carboxyl carrier protein
MDLDRIQELLKLMEKHGLGELELEDKDLKVRLKKATTAAQVQAAVQSAVPAAAAAAPSAAAGAPAAEEYPPNSHVITSPIVGTFYRAPTPDAEMFVDIGDPVDADTVVCIVEAMKVMNEVKAEVPGTILKSLVENGKPVEYGQPLFLVAK